MAIFNYMKGTSPDNMEQPKVNVGKIIFHFVPLIIILLMISGGFRTVGAGERGIRLTFGAVDENVLVEGLHIKVPLAQKIVKMDVKIQKNEVSVAAASKDLQVVNSTIALNYHVDPVSAPRLYQEVGVEYDARIIAPAIQESVKAIESQFTAEELITRREEVKIAIKANIAARLLVRGIIVDEFNIINFQFSNAFDEAIEAKVTAEQLKLKADRDLERIKIEKEQMIAAAQGKAEAIRIEAAALSANAKVIELRYIEKWDGKMPQFWGGATPFVGINK